VSSWGGPSTGYDWPTTEHGLWVDHKQNVWITSSHNREGQVLKFTRDGKFLLQIGKKGRGEGSNDTSSLGGPAGVVVDPKTDEVFIADGYVNRRVIVFDANTGDYRRHWGAYGEKPSDEPFTYDPDQPLPRHFSSVHCLALSRDDLLYVCDRASNRIQVFRKDGTFVTEVQIEPRTEGASGTPDGLAFSHDPRQQFLYVADGGNERIWILRRSDLKIVGSFGHGGHDAGGFITAHAIGVDSQGNIYVGESTDGKRVQRFRYKGLRRVRP
jgi:DNA-binding beta-propeller fold protein YncE